MQASIANIEARVYAVVVALAVAMLPCNTAIAESGGIASPTVTDTAGNVTITYGNITINRTLPPNGPTKAQIQAVVQQVIARNVSGTENELKELLERELDILDGLVKEVGQLRLQITTMDASADERFLRLLRKLEDITELLDHGKTAEARDQLGDIYDITKTGRTTTLRALAQATIRGSPLRLFTLSFLQSYDMAVWPEHIGSSSFAVGWGVTLGAGNARGGYASPSPEHPLVTSSRFSVGVASVRGTLNWMFLRDRSVQLVTSLELETGIVLYDAADHNVPNLNTGLYELHTLQGIVTRVFGRSFMSITASVGFEPWARRPVFAYSGIGAAYEPPRSFRGIDVGITASISIR